MSGASSLLFGKWWRNGWTCWLKCLTIFRLVSCLGSIFILALKNSYCILKLLVNFWLVIISVLYLKFRLEVKWLKPWIQQLQGITVFMLHQLKPLMSCKGRLENFKYPLNTSCSYFTISGNTCIIMLLIHFDIITVLYITFVETVHCNKSLPFSICNLSAIFCKQHLMLGCQSKFITWSCALFPNMHINEKIGPQSVFEGFFVVVDCKNRSCLKVLQA